MTGGENTCRTCGKLSEQEDASDLFPLFVSTEYDNEIKMILTEFEIWNLDISENDGLPQNICLTCFDSFCQIHNFRVICQEAQVNFGELCTGLDIIIKMESEGNQDFNVDFPEDFEGEQTITIQEHYRFPHDERSKVPEIRAELQPTIDMLNKIKAINEGRQDKELENNETVGQQEIKEFNAEIPDFKPYRCEFCMDVISFDDPDLLNEHYNILHSTDTPYLCPKCEKCFDTKFKRNLHAKTHYRIMVECEICGKKLRGGKPIMAQHNELHHVEKDRECLTCGKIFPKATLKTFNYHMSWHDDAKLHKCKYCEKKFIQITHLVVHEKSHNGSSVYQCYECGVGFTNNDLLNEHKKNHEAEEKKMLATETGNYQRKSSRCEICKKTFRSLINLRLHNYKKHGAMYSSSDREIVKHRQSAVVVKPYKCSKCSESFLLHTQLVIHLKAHDENKPFRCIKCAKTFKKDKYLKLHYNTVHLKKKNYVCQTCGMAFMLKVNLDDHIALKHSETKDFKCDICDKAFAFEKALKNHMLKHIERKPYACTVCSKSFRQLNVLKVHVKSHQKKNTKVSDKYVVQLIEHFAENVDVQ